MKRTGLKNADARATQQRRGFSRLESGQTGERDVVRLVRCPNCDSKLMRLPPQFPIYDIQCTRCLFRAQVKSVAGKPRDELFGGGYAIRERYKRTGGLPAPLIANFHWKERGVMRREVYFFPFLTDANIRRRRRSAESAHPGYREFNYFGLLGDQVARVRLLPKAVPATKTPGRRQK